MTLQGPDFIALQVDDLGRAERFYTEVIGLTRAQARPEAVVFATEPIPFADGPFGQTFTFADPDGYRITVHDGR